VSIKGKMFGLPQPDGTTRTLPLGSTLGVMVVGISPQEPTLFSKNYFEAAYQDGDAEAPTCSSEDGLEPSQFVTTPQAKTCASCQWNRFGTARGDDGTARKGKACSDTKHLLIVPLYNQGIPVAERVQRLSEGQVMQLQVPPTSLKALTELGKSLAAAGAEVNEIGVHITFSDATSPQLVLSPARWLDPEEITVLDEISGRAATQAMISTKSALPAEQAVIPQTITAPAAVEPAEPVEHGPSNGGWSEPTTAGDPTAGQPTTLSQIPPEQQLDVDREGVAWDPAIHATAKTGGGILKANGCWRARRGGSAKTAEAPASTEPPPPPPGAVIEEQGASQAVQDAEALLSSGGWE
jgi:hypothetical protein